MKLIKPLFLGLILSLLSPSIRAQHTYLPLGTLSNQLLDRYEVLSGELNDSLFHTETKSFRRKSVSDYALGLLNQGKFTSIQDQFNIRYLLNDNPEWYSDSLSASKRKWGKQFFQQKSALFSLSEKDYAIVVNPVLDYQYSSDKTNNINANLDNRGLEVRGRVGKNIGFYTRMNAEVIRPYSWSWKLYEYDRYFQGANFVKWPEPGTITYFLSNAYVSANLNPYMDLQFGNTRNFIGDGYRSFILGDNQPEYLNMRLNTRFWKINYTNIWAELRDFAPWGNGGRNQQPRHYMAMHHFSINLSKKLNIGLFETILFQRDSGTAPKGFELNYLNPVVFYKSIENGLNSVDKALIGFHAKWLPIKKMQVYGQFVLAEFVFKELVAGNGSYVNKFAVQGGAKYYNAFGVSNLDLQGEVNVSRPFMYSSYATFQPFSNFRQSLGHPLGGNFREVIGIVRYQPKPKIFVMGKLIYMYQGLDSNGSNWGSNPRLSYNDISSGMTGNFIGQGVLTKTLFAELICSWMPKHNLWLDMRLGYRKASSVLATYSANTSFVTLGVRYTIGARFFDY